MKFLGIIALSVAASILYGILHDQVTAHLCVEYFTIGHPRIFETESPTLLAFGWGVVATWWVGLALGIPLALCCCVGPAPLLGPLDLLRPVGLLLICMAGLALIAGVAGYGSAISGRIVLLPPLADRIPPERHAVFLADLWAHLASYLSGFLGGIGLCAWAVIRRLRLARREAPPAKPS
jgi:hypothetical protein